MMTTATTHNPLLSLNMAVLADGRILMHDYKSQTESFINSSAVQLYSLDALIDVAHAYRLNTLWIAPGSELSTRARQLMIEADPSLAMRKSDLRDGTPRFLLVWRKEGTYAERNSVKIAFPEWDSRWPWQTCTHAETLFHSIKYLQEAIDYEIAWSPGKTGQELMFWHNRNHEDWLNPSGSPADIRNNLAKALQWKRPLTSEEKRIPMYLHLFDKSSQHLAACTGVELGQGSPEYVRGDEVGIQFMARVPGLWNVQGWGWLWTPELEYQFARLADETDARPKIAEAWLWLSHHTALRTWGEDLWNARRELTDDSTWQGGGYPYTDEKARKLALQAVKLIYTISLGWLAHPSEDSQLYRPDWWSMVVSTARRNMQFKMRKLAHKGISVCYVDTDTLGVISGDESIEEYQNLILDREGQLGGFRHVKTRMLDPKVARTFEDDCKFIDCYKALDAL